MRLPHHGRYDYSGIKNRPLYDWPGGKRLAVYIGLNLEHFAFGEGLGAELAPSHQPDVLNYAWRDYGARVGIWRIMEVLERQGQVADQRVEEEQRQVDNHRQHKAQPCQVSRRRVSSNGTHECCRYPAARPDVAVESHWPVACFCAASRAACGVARPASADCTAVHRAWEYLG